MNQLSQQELWEKIQTFKLDDPTSAFPFSKKLAKENNWDQSFTNRAIEEYKKFIFLCCILPTGASPSAIVDDVWHLHLTYTDSYWNKFCKQTLSKEIHHHPSKGGTIENEKHVDWYQRTLQSYEATFESKAPADIWPSNQQPTGEIEEKIYEPVFLKKIVFIFSAAIVIFISFVNLFHTKGPNFLTYYLLICLAGLITLFISQKHKERQLKRIVMNNLPQKFTPYQIARFLYGNHRCYQTALVDLLRKSIIETHGKDYKLVKHELDERPEENPLLQPLLRQYNEGDTFTYKEGFALINSDAVIHPGLERLHRLSQKVDYAKFIIPGVIVLIGFARFLQGLSNDKPVGLLVFEIMTFTLVVFGIMETYSYTKLVGRLLDTYWCEQNSYGRSDSTINNFTILGVPAIAGFAEYKLLKNVFNSMMPSEKKPGAGSSSSCSSCGSSCSSGGGCGGCGGGD